MALLSKETEQDLKLELLTMIKDYLEQQTSQSRKTGLITLEAVKDELEISTATLKRWEMAGLRCYQPPLENGKKVYYLLKDIYSFLAIDG